MDNFCPFFLYVVNYVSVLQVTACCLQGEDSPGRSTLTDNGIETVGLDLTSVDSMKNIKKIVEHRFEHKG